MTQIAQFAHDHSESLTLLAIAFAVTMRKTLPWPLRLVEPLEWAYGWVRDALMTFVSLRGPSHHESLQQSEATKTVTEPGGKKTETSFQQATIMAVVEPIPEKDH